LLFREGLVERSDTNKENKETQEQGRTKEITLVLMPAQNGASMLTTKRGFNPFVDTSTVGKRSYLTG